MKTILGERGQVKVTIDERLNEDFALMESNLGKKKTYRIYRKDKESFEVNLDNMGHVMSVSSFLYEDVNGGCLLFWSYKHISFRANSLINKVIHISLNGNEIDIKFDNEERQGIE